MEIQQDIKLETATPRQKHALQKAKVIEFVGPPGAGKTSNCYYYASVLRQKGFEVITLRDIKCHVKALSSSERTLLFVKTFGLHLPTLLAFIMTLGMNSIFSGNSITRYLKIAVFNTLLQRLLKTYRVDYVLLEQWMIQELWSATIFKLKSYTKIERQLSRFYLPVDYLLYFDIDMETASTRITNRTSKLSRFDRMDPKRRVRKLKQYNQYLYHLYTFSPCPHKHVISTKTTPEENVIEFLQHLQP